MAGLLDARLKACSSARPTGGFPELSQPTPYPIPQLEAELVALSQSIVALAGGSSPSAASSAAAGPAESGVIGSADDIVLELGTPRPGAHGCGSVAAASTGEVGPGQGGVKCYRSWDEQRAGWLEREVLLAKVRSISCPPLHPL